MNVLIISPAYPADMPQFTRGLAECGATVVGLGDQPPAALPDLVKHSLSSYVQVPSLWKTDQVVREIRSRLKGMSLDRIECLWEPGVMLAAELREHFGLSGLNIEQAHRFRDKEAMKQALDEAGIRTPRHIAVKTAADCWDAAQEIGFPVIVKPIAGAGSADTFRVNSQEELHTVLPLLRHVDVVSVEEFIDGEEYTFDTITVNGKIQYYNVAWYRPRPLVARSNEWISPQVIALQDLQRPELAGGIKMGHEVIKALQFDTGFTHMEWYRKHNGEVIFGEIGGRPPGAHQVDQMRFVCDFDPFLAWGQAVTQGKLEMSIEQLFNVALIFKRAHGVGHITRIEGMDSLQQRFGEHVVWETLLRPGARRRDWLQTLVSDGFVMLRHKDLDYTLEMADAVASELHLFAE